MPIDVPSRLNLPYRLKEEHSAEVMRVAALLDVHSALQAAGLWTEGLDSPTARLSDEHVVRTLGALDPESANELRHVAQSGKVTLTAVLRVLIRDHDRDGRLDLDLGALIRSGLVVPGTSHRELLRALTVPVGDVHGTSVHLVDMKSRHDVEDAMSRLPLDPAGRRLVDCDLFATAGWLLMHDLRNGAGMPIYPHLEIVSFYEGGAAVRDAVDEANDARWERYERAHAWLVSDAGDGLLRRQNNGVAGSGRSPAVPGADRTAKARALYDVANIAGPAKLPVPHLRSAATPEEHFRWIDAESSIESVPSFGPQG